MRFETVGKSQLILRLVQILICLFMVIVFYNLGQYIQIPEIFKEATEKDPGKPALFLSLDKSEYSVGEPTLYREVIINDGNSDIKFPVVLGDGELGYVTYFITYVTLTNEKGENIQFDIPPGNYRPLPLSIGIVTVKPREAVPCFGCTGNLLKYVLSSNTLLSIANYSNALKTPGSYYLQTVFFIPNGSDHVRIIQGNGVSYLTDSYPNFWKGVLLSNRVKFEIKP
jgi:hypothetical protein